MSSAHRRYQPLYTNRGLLRTVPPIERPPALVTIQSGTLWCPKLWHHSTLVTQQYNPHPTPPHASSPTAPPPQSHNACSGTHNLMTSCTSGPWAHGTVCAFPGPARKPLFWQMPADASRGPFRFVEGEWHDYLSIRLGLPLLPHPSTTTRHPTTPIPNPFARPLHCFRCHDNRCGRRWLVLNPLVCYFLPRPHVALLTFARPDTTTSVVVPGGGGATTTGPDATTPPQLSVKTCGGGGGGAGGGRREGGGAFLLPVLHAHLNSL